VKGKKLNCQTTSQGLLSTGANYNISPSIEREREKQREGEKKTEGRTCHII